MYLLIITKMDTSINLEDKTENENGESRTHLRELQDCML